MRLLLGVSAATGLVFYQVAMATLRGNPDPSPFWRKRWRDAVRDRRTYRPLAAGLVVSLLFLTLSVGAIYGVGVDFEEARHLQSTDIRLLIPRFCQWINFSPFADFEEEDVSKKPDNWSDGKEDAIASVRGARLRGSDLRYALASHAFLVNADLRAADLQGAVLQAVNLRNANLRGAHLRDANLQDADLRGADLGMADLEGTSRPRRGPARCQDHPHG